MPKVLKRKSKSKKHGPSQKIEGLINKGFFDSPKDKDEVKAELKRVGFGFFSDEAIMMALLCHMRKGTLDRFKQKSGKRTVYKYKKK